MLHQANAIKFIFTLIVCITQGKPLRADEKRLWLNNSDTSWTIVKCKRGTYIYNDNKTSLEVNREIGNMWFQANGKELGKIGESSNNESITLAPHAAVEVEFTHTDLAFRHYFKLIGDDNYSFIAIAADHPMTSWDVGRKPVELQSDEYQLGTCASLARPPVRADRDLPKAERSKYLCGIILNAPNMGDLTITDQFKPQTSNK